jgi:hypothetical protein
MAPPAARGLPVLSSEMSKKPPEDKRIARRRLLAGGVALAGSAAAAGMAARSARAAGDNLPPNVPHG